MSYKGFTFTATVPTSSSWGEGMGKKKNIMVVDDNPDIMTSVKTLLEVKGYKVQSAYSGTVKFQ